MYPVYEKTFRITKSNISVQIYHLKKWLKKTLKVRSFRKKITKLKSKIQVFILFLYYCTKRKNEIQVVYYFY